MSTELEANIECEDDEIKEWHDEIEECDLEKKADGEVVELEEDFPDEIFSDEEEMEINEQENDKSQEAIDFPDEIFTDEENNELNEQQSEDYMREISENVRKSNLPKSKGTWENEVGNSGFYLDDEAEFIYKEKTTGTEVTITGKELKEKYGMNEIEYKNGEPDFSLVEDEFLNRCRIDSLPVFRQGGSYKQAEEKFAGQTGLNVQEVRDYMKGNNLTFHESGDMHTISAIPSDIHSIFKHTGGIGIKKNINTIGEILLEDRDGLILDNESMIQGVVSGNEIKKSLDYSQKRYRQRKKKL
ncbi:MAG: HNH endonuclease [Lachnospiraceae bacterium]|nr:HNH endonuclease [Lachnospiraceae bacterium]